MESLGRRLNVHHHFSTASFKMAHFQASPTFLVLFCHICLNTNWRTRGGLGTRLMPRLAWSDGPLVPISENSLTHPLLPLHTPQSDVDRRTQSRKRIEEMGTTAKWGLSCTGYTLTHYVCQPYWKAQAHQICGTCNTLYCWSLVSHQLPTWIFCNRIYHHYFYLHISATLTSVLVSWWRR